MKFFLRKVVSAWDKFIQHSETLNEEEQSKNENLRYFIKEYFEKNYLGFTSNGKTKKPRFPVDLWNVFQSTLDGKKVTITSNFFILFIMFQSIICSGLPRTNNVAEGWHNAFGSMTGVKRPTVYRFIKELIKDADITRGKIVVCQSGTNGPPQKKAYKQRDEALKNAVINYLASVKQQEEMEAEKEEDIDADSDEEMATDGTNQWTRGHDDERDQWLKSPEFVLMKATAHSLKL